MEYARAPGLACGLCREIAAAAASEQPDESVMMRTRWKLNDLNNVFHRLHCTPRIPAHLHPLHTTLPPILTNCSSSSTLLPFASPSPHSSSTWNLTKLLPSSASLELRAPPSPPLLSAAAPRLSFWIKSSWVCWGYAGWSKRARECVL